MIFRPMLAADADLEKLRFPLLASAKLDGVRAVVRDGVVYSRSNKPIPNDFVQQVFGPASYYDGELVVGYPNSKTVYRDTVSGVMSKDGQPDVKFYVFDHIQYTGLAYRDREAQIKKPTKLMFKHEQHKVMNIEELLSLEQRMLEEGYEGLILRDPLAPYKMGRSTANEGYLLKLKRFIDAEFRVVGFEERLHNGNEATVNELGRTKRSSHKANKTGRGDLGALVLQHPGGFLFNVGTGFTDAERSHIWEHQEAFLGALAKVKYFAIGMKDAPRHPVFLGWRHLEDK